MKNGGFPLPIVVVALLTVSSCVSSNHLKIPGAVQAHRSKVFGHILRCPTLGHRDPSRGFQRCSVSMKVPYSEHLT